MSQITTFTVSSETENNIFPKQRKGGWIDSIADSRFLYND